MEYLLLGGIAAVGEHFISPLTFGPLYQALKGVNESFPAGVNGSIMGVGAYLITEALYGHKMESSEILGIVASVVVLQVALGRLVYWPLASKIGQQNTSYLFNAITGLGTVLGVILADKYF